MAKKNKTDDLLLQLTREAEIARRRATSSNMDQTVSIGVHDRVTSPNVAFRAITEEQPPVTYARWIEACRTGRIPDNE